MQKLTRRIEFYVFLAIVLLSAIITSRSSRFFSLENLFDILKSYAVLGVLSVGTFVVILSGGIDISCAAMAQVSEYVMVATVNAVGGNLVSALLTACICGTILGGVNGLLIYLLKIPPIITTIATYNVFYGLLYVFSKGKIIISYPKFFSTFANTPLLHINAAGGAGYDLSVVVAIWILVIILAFFILRYTSLGRNIYCIGGNMIAARRAGINVFRTQVFVYCFMGFLSGVAAIVHFCVVLTVVPSSIVGRELDAIAAVVLGGANIVGGSGTILGSILGVILFAAMSNGLTLMKVSSYWYKLFIGLVIIVSVSISAIRLRAGGRRRSRVS
jgi:simple sugar transport system permease protein